MRVSTLRSLAAGAAAVMLSVVGTVNPNPAEAACFHGGGGFGGFHGGFGGFHGAGIGRWHGGGWGRPGWGWGRPGWGWGGGHWNNGWWGPAFAGGLLLGTAATYPYWGGDYGYTGYGFDNGYGYDNGYNTGCWVSRPVYNRHGRYIGRGLVNVCQ